MKQPSATATNVIGEKTFGPADQESFAQLSLDRNPMHMDPVAARRLLTGSQVVHGVHLLLSALEFALVGDARVPTSVRCTFSNPVSLGDRVRFSVIEVAGDDLRIEAAVGALVCCQLHLTHGEQPRGEAAIDATAQGDALWSRLARPLDEPPDGQLGKRFAIDLVDGDWARAFPRCVERLGWQSAASIARLSYMVGMVCPGLHSVFSSLRLQLRGTEPGSLVFSVDKYDRRVQLFDISFDGCVSGSLKAFRRPPPQRQPSIAHLSAEVGASEFSAARSLVIGGSRGLGELTARLLATGGGEVAISYAKGLEDALALCEEINSAARGSCSALRIDLLEHRFDALPIDWTSFDAVYFFPTPRIFRKLSGVFDTSVFAEFTHFYVDKFYELCVLLESQPRTKKVKVFLPSTSALAERPRGMTEYTMAKAAAETLVEDINRSFRNVKVTAARLPRLATDQTATILKVETVSGVDVLLPILRALSA